MPHEGLGEFEQMVLLAVVRLSNGDGDVYGVPIVEEIEKRTKRKAARAAVYITLRRLERKGLIAETGHSDYGKAFEAIQKRVAARLAVFKLCERDIVKLCPSVQKGDRGAAVDCLLAGPRGIGINCGKSLGEAGFR